jgi:hypothetical protein
MSLGERIESGSFGCLVSSAVAVGAAILMLGLGWHWLTTPGPTPQQQRIETEGQALQLQRAREQAARDAANAKADQGWDPGRPATWFRLLEISVLGTLVLAVPAALAGIGLHVWHRRDLPEPDGRVRLPGLTAEQRLAAHMGFLRVSQTRAEHPPLPAGLQNLHTTNAPRITGGAQVSEPEVTVTVPEAEPAIPTLVELLMRREVGPGRLLSLGWDPAARSLIRCEPTEDGDLFAGLYSAGVGGHQGSGKSRDAEWLVIQAALLGAGLRLCDAHGRVAAKSLTGRLRPLEAAFLGPIAIDQAEILAAIRETRAEAERRLARGIGDAPPQLLVVDEWNRVIDEEGGEEAAEHVERIAREGRKVGVNALLLAQAWTKRSVGELRNHLAACFLHRMRPDEARLLRPGAPNDTLQLARGECYVLPTDGAVHRVRVPFVDEAAVALAAQMLPAVRRLATVPRTVPGPFPSRSGPVPDCSEAGPPELGNSADAPLARSLEPRALELFRAGLTVPDIVLELYGLRPAGGRPYQAATAAVTAVIRDALPAPLTVVDGATAAQEGDG